MDGTAYVYDDIVAGKAAKELAVHGNDVGTSKIIEKNEKRQITPMDFMKAKDADSIILQALKSDAHYWTNKMALDTRPEIFDSFTESQKKLTYWKGEYVSKKMLHNRPDRFAKKETQENYGTVPKYSLVKYIHYKDKKETMEKPAKRVVLTKGKLHASDEDNIALYSLDDLIETILQADMSKESLGVEMNTYYSILHDIKQKAIDPSQAKTFWRRTTFLGSKYDKMGRYSQWESGWRESSDKSFKYMCNQNTILLTISEPYHNPNTIEKINNDFKRIEKSSIHIDLIVVLPDGDEMVWTVYRHFPGSCAVSRLSYVSDGAKQSLLLDQRPLSPAESKYSSPLSSLEIIESSSINKFDELSLLEWHAHFCREDQMTYSRFKHNHEHKSTNVCFVFRIDDICVIASSIVIGSTTKSVYTNYSIFEFEDYSGQRRSNPSLHAPQTPDKNFVELKSFVHQINDRINGLKLLEFKSEVPESYDDKADCFIPSVFLPGSGNSTRLGCLCLTDVSKTNRDSINMERGRIEMEILPKYFQINEETNFKLQLEAELRGTYGIKYIRSFPGVVGKYLETKNNVPAIHDWTVKWTEYMQIRNIGYKWYGLNSTELKRFMANLQDKSDQRSAKSKYRTAQRFQPRGRGGGGYRGGYNRANHIATQPARGGAAARGKDYGGVDDRANHSATQPTGGYQYRGGWRPSALNVGGHGQRRGEYTPIRPMADVYTQNSSHSLAAAVGCTDFIPQSKMQAEIDTLKRTLNELTLRGSLP